MTSLTIPAQYRKPVSTNIYAETYEVVSLEKPHVRFHRGAWRCGWADEDMALHWSWGETPEAAYENWKQGERAFV